MPYVTVRVEVGDERLAGREVAHLEVRQAVGAHAHLALAFAPTPAMRAAAAAQAAERAGGVQSSDPAPAAVLLHAVVRVLLVDEAGTAHVAFQGRVAGVRSVQRPRAGRQVLVTAWSDSAALSAHAVVRRWPAHTLAAVAGTLGVRVIGAPDATGDAPNLVQDGVPDWAFLARLASEAGMQLVPDWPRHDGSADDDNPGAAAGAEALAVVRAGFGPLEHELVHGRDLLAFAVAVREAEPDVAGAMSDTSTKHDHRFRLPGARPAWLSGAQPFRTVVDARLERPTPSTDALGGAKRDAGLGGGGEGALPAGGASGGALGPAGRVSTLVAARRRLHLAGLRRSGAAVWAAGRSTCPALRAGDQAFVTVNATGGDGVVDPAVAAVWAEGMPDAVGGYGLAAVVHRWDGALYENWFVATPWADYHPHAELLAPDAAELDDAAVGGDVLGAALGRAGESGDAWGLYGPVRGAGAIVRPAGVAFGGASGSASGGADPDGREATLFAAGSLGRALLALGVPPGAVAGHAGVEGAAAGGASHGVSRGVHAGLVSAIVTANADPRGWGRVRVRFAWQQPDEPAAWARVAAPAAGKGRGIGSLPEIGDEVLVAFQGADPEHPVVVGSVWNGVDVAGHRPGLQHWLTAGGNAHVLVDDKGQERQELYTPGGRTRLELTHQGPTGAAAGVFYSDGDLVLECKGTLHVRAGAVRTEVAGAVETSVGGAYTVQAKGALTVTSDGALGVAGTGAVTVRAGGVLHAHGGGAHRITGPTVAINETGATPPTVRAQLGAALASVAAARAIPALAPGRSTADARSRRRPDRADPVPPRTWIGVHLVTPDGVPLAGGGYDVVASDGRAHGGSTDDRGRGRVASLAPGECTVWVGAVAAPRRADDAPDDALWPPIAGDGAGDDRAGGSSAGDRRANALDASPDVGAADAPGVPTSDATGDAGRDLGGRAALRAAVAVDIDNTDDTDDTDDTDEG